jgi:hypothetical protein
MGGAKGAVYGKKSWHVRFSGSPPALPGFLAAHAVCGNFSGHHAFACRVATIVILSAAKNLG